MLQMSCHCIDFLASSCLFTWIPTYIAGCMAVHVCMCVWAEEDVRKHFKTTLDTITAPCTFG